jgi:hypothetical protein
MSDSLALAARAIAALGGDRRRLVAVDGVDGAGSRRLLMRSSRALIGQSFARLSMTFTILRRSVTGEIAIHRRGSTWTLSIWRRSRACCSSRLLRASNSAAESSITARTRPYQWIWRMRPAMRYLCWTDCSCIAASCEVDGTCRSGSTCRRTLQLNASWSATAVEHASLVLP